MPDLGLDLVFHYPGRDELQQSAKCFFGNVDRLLYNGHFFGGLDGTHLVHDPGRTAILMQWVTLLHLIDKAVFAGAQPI